MRIYCHTHGPWKAQAIDGGWEINSDPPRGKKWTAIAVTKPNHLGSQELTTDECEANVRLMAASPEMLALLLAVLECENRHDLPYQNTKAASHWRELSAEIAKVVDKVAIQ